MTKSGNIIIGLDTLSSEMESMSAAVAGRMAADSKRIDALSELLGRIATDAEGFIVNPCPHTRDRLKSTAAIVRNELMTEVE